MKKTLIPLISLSLSLVAAAPVFAMVSNNTQSAQCPNPSGTLIASYTDGWHAVVGFSQTILGTDTVTNIGNQNFVQCFCPTAQKNQTIKSGIQSNWLYAGNISTNEQQQLINTGWQLRHDGTSFGLPQNNYFVKNYSFSCKNTGSVSIKRSVTTQVHNGSVSTYVKNNTVHVITK